MLERFKKFLVAVPKLVSAIVADLITPLLYVVLPRGAWREFSISFGTEHAPLKIGDVLGTAVHSTRSSPGS